MFQLDYYMALVAVGAYQPERRLSKSRQQFLSEQTSFLRTNGIIPMLESNISEFEDKFGNAVIQYSYYVIQLNEQYSFISTKSMKNRKAMSESYLKAMSILRKRFSNIDDNEIRSAILEAISKIEDYFLLVGDKKINVRRAKYNPIMGALFTIWVSIMGLSEVLSNDNYRNKTNLLIQKIENGTKKLEDYLITIAQDHGRVFSQELNQTLEGIDSGNVKMVTQTANQLIKQMRKELAVEK